MQTPQRPPPSTRDPYWGIWLVVGPIVAWITFAFGLVAPLTPSEGFPAFREIVIFIGVPLSILAWCTWECRTSGLGVFFGLQLFALGGFAAILLRRLWSTSF